MRKVAFFLFSAIALFLISGCTANICQKGEKSGKVSMEPAFRMEKNALLIDVRTPEEFTAGHLKGAVNIPHGKIVACLQKKGVKKDVPLYLYCRSGRRVKEAIKNLKKASFTHLYDLGGMNDASEKTRLSIVK